MTPIEKATEIINKIFNAQHVDDRAKMICLSTYVIAESMVNEVIGIIEQWMYIDLFEANENMQYWQEVKKEILKLKSE